MPARKKSASAKRTKAALKHQTQSDVETALAWLESRSTNQDRENMERFAISATQAFGVSMANMKLLAKQLGRNHELAAELWATGWYEARMVASMVDEPERVTSAQMDRWCREFDNWGICDTVCFHLFDRSQHAWRKVAQWSDQPEEFVKRAAFALLACLALHDKTTPDQPFVESLLLVERASTDERNFVKKAVSWALRAIGNRNPALNAAALTLARRLVDSGHAAAKWVGKDALRDLTSPATRRRLEARNELKNGPNRSRGRWA